MIRDELAALLRRWQAGSVAAPAVKQWAESARGAGDAVVHELLADLELLQVHLLTSDDVPALLAALDGTSDLAAAIGEERDTIEDVIEPFLIQQGYLMRTPRGRLATATAWRHFGLHAPSAPGQMQRGIFEE